MLTLTGTLRAATVLGGGVNRKTGEVIKQRPVLQIEGLDNRGLVQLFTLTVPSIDAWQAKLGEQISLPVRAWAPGAAVGFVYEAEQ